MVTRIIFKQRIFRVIMIVMLHHDERARATTPAPGELILRILRRVPRLHRSGAHKSSHRFHCCFVTIFGAEQVRITNKMESEEGVTSRTRWFPVFWLDSVSGFGACSAAFFSYFGRRFSTVAGHSCEFSSSLEKINYSEPVTAY